MAAMRMVKRIYVEHKTLRNLDGEPVYRLWRRVLQVAQLSKLLCMMTLHICDLLPVVDDNPQATRY